MGSTGGSVLAGILDKLSTEIDEYLGALNEVKAGLGTRLPEKPTALILYEQTKEMGIPLVAGGVEDQPHIWLEMYAICMQKTKLWETIEENNRRNRDRGREK